MSDTKIDPWALLREARALAANTLESNKIEDDEPDCRCKACEHYRTFIARTDAALAAQEAEERVDWTPLADGKACASEVNGYLVEVRPSYAGDGWWAWKVEQPVMHRDRQHGHKRTKELAQEAAIVAARGLK